MILSVFNTSFFNTILPTPLFSGELGKLQPSSPFLKGEWGCSNYDGSMHFGECEWTQQWE